MPTLPAFPHRLIRLWRIRLQRRARDPLFNLRRRLATGVGAIMLGLVAGLNGLILLGTIAVARAAI